MSRSDQDLTVDEETADEGRSRGFDWRSKKGIGIVLGIAAAVVVLVLLVVFLVRANADQGPDAVAVTVPVAISEVNPPDDAKLGVVVTLGTGDTPGSQWHQAAQGAVVAQQRLALGGHDIELLTQDDVGSQDGSVEAVQQLIDQGVSGIVYASAGSHMSEGLELAAEAGVPVILPYTEASDTHSNVWSLKPGHDDSAAALAAEVASFERPLYINAGGTLPDAVAVSDEEAFGTDTNTDDFAESIALQTGADPYGNGGYTGGGEDEQGPAPTVEDPVDAIVVSGTAQMQARVVYALQTGNVSVPIILTDDAVSPVFDQTLLELGGTVSSNLRTVGAGWDDGIALGSSGQSRAMSAFLTATRQFANREDLTNLTGDAPFADPAPLADVRGHDAVLAFAEAMSRAGTTNASGVAETLNGLQLAAGNGIAGPSLDFSQSTALTVEPTVLHASSQQLGLRPTTGEYSDALVWIVQP